MKKVFLEVGSIFLLLSLCGCAPILIGGGLAAGVAISEDTAKLERDTSFQHAWAVTNETLEEMGVVNSKDKSTGRIEANIGNSKVTARITQITPGAVRIEVKARRKLFPHMGLAVEIVNKIHNKL